MKIKFLALLSACALAGCSGGAENDQAAAPAGDNAAGNNVQTASLPDADPAMWVVKDEDTTIYMFGTFHLLDGKTDWFNDEVRQAFDQAQEVVFEVPMGGDQNQMAQAMQPLIMQHAIERSGRRVSADLTEEENRKLNAALTEIGVPPQLMDRFEPWFVALSLTQVLAKRLGMTPESGAESVLHAAARSRNLQVGGVETLESQMQVFDGLPRAAQVVQLKDTLKRLDEMQGQLREMLTVWNAGDAEGMERLMNEGLREDPALRRALLENRNRAWSVWIDERLDRPGVVFMAVGAGHLVGQDSVQTFLKQRGIDSARVPNLTPAR